MKNPKMLVLAMALGLGWPAVSNGADPVVQFRLSWRGTFYTTNAVGTMIARSFSDRDFVQKAATDNGLDPKTLAFVYRAVKHDTAVVRLADGGFVADVLQMEYDFTEVTSKNQTHTARQAILYNEIDPSGAHGSPLGSAFGLEETQQNSNSDFTSYSFHGTFQYSIDGVVYTGTFATGARVRDTSTPAQ